MQQPDGTWQSDTGEPFPLIPALSVDIKSAWLIVDRLAPMVGSGELGADGFFLLTFDDDSWTPMPIRCSPVSGFEYGPDATAVWTAHFHCGEYMVDRDDYPPLWSGSMTFCASATTAPHAICLAALKGWLRALTPKQLDYLVRVREEGRWDTEEPVEPDLSIGPAAPDPSAAEYIARPVRGSRRRRPTS